MPGVIPPRPYLGLSQKTSLKDSQQVRVPSGKQALESARTFSSCSSFSTDPVASTFTLTLFLLYLLEVAKFATFNLWWWHCRSQITSASKLLLFWWWSPRFIQSCTDAVTSYAKFSESDLLKLKPVLQYRFDHIYILHYTNSAHLFAWAENAQHIWWYTWLFESSWLVYVCVLC